MTCDPTNPGQTHYDGCPCSIERVRREGFAEGAEWAMSRLLDWGGDTHGEPRKALYIAHQRLAVALHGIVSQDHGISHDA